MTENESHVIHSSTITGVHPLVPAFILEQARAGNRRGRFDAVGLFADISGFTTITDSLMSHGQHGAEILAGVMRAAFEPLILAVVQWGGFVTGQAGDSFTALFPVPEQGSGAAAERVFHSALTAAQEICQRAQKQPMFSTQYGAFTVSVKVGLTFGETAWGIISSRDGRHAAYYFSGAAIDGCAEAQSLAQPGEIILHRDLAHRIMAWTQVELVETHYRLKATGFIAPPPGPATAPVMDLPLAERFFSKALLTQASAGEFRQVTYLFIRLPTVRTEEQLDLFMQTVFDLQDQYGGLLKLQFGDKGAHLILMWGAPIAYENDIHRALNFILDLQTRTAIPIHGGITHRIAHAGFIGSYLSEEYTGYGRGANLAARLMTAAPRGELWLDEPTAARANDLRGPSSFEVDYLGEKSFKGFAQPQKVYLLLERKERAEVAYNGALVGREAEDRVLETFIRPILSGDFAGVALVSGEYGMGKSRLVHECLQRLEAETSSGFQVFLAQTDQILRRSLNPFRYWLRRYFGVSEMQVEARNKRSFNRKLDGLIEATADARLIEDLDRTRSFLGALVDLTWPDSLYEQLDAEGRFENTLIGLTALFCAESLQKPVVFFLEDIHWLDVDSQAFLLRLVRVLNASGDLSPGRKVHPIAIVATGREENRKTLLEGMPFFRIELSSLDRSGMLALASSLLGGPPAETLLDFLGSRSEGNPFIIEQILKYLTEEQLLVVGQGVWRSQTALTENLPSDLQGILVARLDRLADQVKDVVQTAAVLGREFEVRLLVEMLAGDDRLDEKIHQAEEQDIWAALSEIRYIFRHTLLRDAAYEMQIQARRRRLHLLALETLERLFSADLAPHFGELAYHAEQAGMIDTARSYLKVAGEMARQEYQNAQAIDYFSHALDLTPEDDIEARMVLLSEREKIYELTGAKDFQQHDLEVLEQLAAQLDDHDPLALQVKLRRCDFYLETGSFSAGLALAQDVMRQAEESGNLQAALSAQVNLCLNLMRQSRNHDAVLQAEVGLQLARQLDNRRAENNLINALGLIATEERRPEAFEYFKQSMQIAEEIGDLRSQSRALNNLGMLSSINSDFISARTYYEQSLILAHQIGNRTGEGVILSNLGYLAGARGAYKQARDYLEQGVYIAREVGNLYYEAYSLINLSGFTGTLGEADLAHHTADAALEIASQLGDRSAQAWAHIYLGHSLIDLDRPAEAEQAYRAALNIRHGLNQAPLVDEPSAGLAIALLNQGDQAAALACVEETIRRIEAGDGLDGCDEPVRVFAACYKVLEACADPRSSAILQKAFAFLQKRAAEIPEEPARQDYLNNNPHHRLILNAYTG